VDHDWIIESSDRVLVTGAAGFVGSKVVEMLLSYGFSNLCCLIRPTSKTKAIESMIGAFKDANIEIVKGNLISTQDCRRITKNVSIVYHLAAGVAKSYPDCFLNSVVTTRNLLDASIEEPSLRRFVNISSIAVYSNKRIKQGGLIDESCELDDRLLDRAEPYTYGKAKQDALVLDYAKRHDLPYVTVRPGVVFGPGKTAMTARIGIDTFGIFLHLGMNNIIPLTFVDNCAEAIVLAGLRKGINGQVFNIFDDNLPKSSEFLKLYKKNVRRFKSVPVPYPVWFFFNYLWEKYSIWSRGQLPPVFNTRKCMIYWKGNRYSNKKVKELLSWQPRVNMNDALERYFEYVKETESH
jgi:nucleoside-diphosphate-sugar epimerase